MIDWILYHWLVRNSFDPEALTPLVAADPDALTQPEGACPDAPTQPEGADPGALPDSLTAPVGRDWFGLSEAPLRLDDVNEFLVRPSCGANVVFTGTTRDHAGNRDGVDLLTYEAYESAALRRLAEVLAEARMRWSEVVALVAIHRVGDVPVGEAAVIVGASSPHREAAFSAAGFCIDAVKATVPIWKRERHSGGADWGLEGASLINAAAVSNPSPSPEIGSES